MSDTLAVAHATATFRDGRRFSESGEATPRMWGARCGRTARLALTRAKARCLRDALNIALCGRGIRGEPAEGALRRPADLGRERASLD